MRAVIGMGSNKGNPEESILAAAAAFEHVPGITPIGLSSGYWSDPIGPPQPRFLNAAIVVDTSFNPRELLAALLGLESGLGRRRAKALGPRTIDLDILVAEDHIVEDDHLILPHPRLKERAFALLPLLELWPEAVDPITGEPLDAVARRLDHARVDPPVPLPTLVERVELDHTADLGFSVTGPTLSKTLEKAALALVDLMADRSHVVERERHVVVARGEDDVELMVELLGEVVFLLDAREFVPRRVSLLSSTKSRVELAVYGEPFVAEHQLKVHVKAVTYHHAVVERDATRKRWSISVVVDL